MLQSRSAIHQAAIDASAAQQPGGSYKIPVVPAKLRQTQLKIHFVHQSTSLQKSKTSDQKITKRQEGADSGQLYEFKLLILFFERGHFQKFSFKLGKQVAAVEKFDDLVFKYVEEGKDFYRFLQAKHIIDESKKITSGILLAKEYGHKSNEPLGEYFNLQKYFVSYREIKKEFESSLKFKDGVLKDVIIFTNIDFDVHELKEAGIGVKKIEVPDSILGIANPEKSAARYQLQASEENKLYKILKDTSDLNRLATELAKHAFDNNKNTRTIRIDKNPIFTSYHVALAEEVVDAKSGKFKDNFINNQGLSTVAANFRKTFLTVGLKQLKHMESEEAQENDFWEQIKGRQMSLSNGFGVQQISKKKGKKEAIESNVDLPRDIVKEEDIKDFLNHLVFAVNQPNLDQLGELIEYIELKKAFNLVNIDFISSSLEKNIQSWVNENKDKEGWISCEQSESFFKKAKQMITSSQAVGMTLAYEAKIREYGVEFKTPINGLKDYLHPTNKEQIFHITTLSEKTLLSSIKVYQALKVNTDYQTDDSYIFVNLKLLLNEQNNIVENFESAKTNLLIIECDSVTTEQDIKELYGKLSKVMKDNTNKKIILIAKQDDALVSLFKTHTELDDTISFSDLIPDSQKKLLEKEVTFQGEQISLNKLVDENSKELIDLETLVKLIDNNEITIGNKLMSLGEISDYYIDRKFNYQIEIKTEVFKARESTHLLAISGFDKAALSRLASEGSKIRLYQENDPDKSNPIRFIILDNQKAKEQFNKLIQNKHYKKYSIHWLKKEESEIFWQKSKGAISGIRQYIEVDESHDKHYSEADLLSQDNQHKILIVSDTAGMGKSTVLTELSEKIKKKFPYLWVVRVDLNDYTKVLDEELEKRRFNEASFNPANSDEAVNFLLYKLLESNEQLKLKTSLEKELFKCRFKHQGKIAVLFDGFDEISPDYKEVVIDLLLTLINTKVEKLWVTTRPHMRAVLEDKLGVFSYTLTPFSEENQIEFLTKFWQKRLELTDNNRLKIYAEKLIKQLANSISDKEKEFTGIPLQTRMLAVAFEENYKQFYQSNKVEPELTEKLDLIILYERFINNKFDIYQEEKNRIDTSKPGIKSQQNSSKKQWCIYHQKLALQLLFSEQQVSSFRLQNGQFKLSNDTLARIGIVQILNDNPHFIHRTFAEYFAANFLASQLAENWKDQKVQEFLLTDILIKSDYQVIRAFLNGQLAKEQLSQSALTHYGKKIDNLWSAQNNLRNKHGHTILHIASIEAHTKIINFLLDSLREYSETLKSLMQATTNYNYYYKQTALHLAAYSGHLEVVKLLVEQGANVNAKDTDGNTVLHMAAESGNLDLVQWLVDHGANVNATSRYDRTVLHSAAKTGNLDMVKWLVEDGADVNATTWDGETVLHWAVDRDNWDMIKWLVEHGADVNATDKDGLTVLHRAADKSNWNIVKWLVEHGADVNAADKHGSTALYRASKWGNWNVVKWLVEHGADVYATTKDGETMLHWAVDRDNWNIVKWLVEHGADVNAADKHGWTALYRASEWGNCNVVKWLVEHGADVNVTDKHCWTVLHWAANQGNLDVIKWLVERGADVNAADKHGWTALYRASEWGNWDVVKWLVEHGADVYATDKHGWTVLHWAANQGNLDVVKWLVEHGSDVNATDKDGWKLLHRAAQFGNSNVVKCLVEHGADVYATD